jgi:hypothetical protein
MSMFDPRNLFTLPAMIAGNFRYADWKAARKRGLFGMLTEFLRATTGLNTMAFFVPTKSIIKDGFEVGNPAGYWNQARVSKLLRQHGVKSWGYGYWIGEMYFRVERRQMHWAQYVMRRAGVPLLHGALAGSRANPQQRTPAKKASGR